MTLQSIIGSLWLPAPAFKAYSGAPTMGNAATIDAADESVGIICRIPKTGNISKILWATRTVTGSTATITVRGETVDETVNPAVPSGSLYAGNANFTGTTSVLATDDNIAVLTSLTAAVAVTRGDKIAIVIKQPNTSFNTLQVAGFSDDVSEFPYIVHNTGVSPAKSWAGITNSAPILGLEYDDGSYAPVAGCYPFFQINSNTYNNSSTPDEIGLRFRLPFPCTIAKWWAWLDADGDFNVNLYDSDGATKISGTQVVCDKDTRLTAAAGIQMMPLTVTANLLANTYYRLVIEPSSATNLILYDAQVNAAAQMDAMPGGQDFHFTSAKNPAAEGDWTQSTTKRPFMGIGISAFDDGAGSGIKTHRGMTGGMNG